MGLILNTISGSSAGERGALSDRPVIGVTGSVVFHPDSGIQAASPDGTAGKSLADLHRDAAYIFSGSAGGDDRTIFLGDVVVSGSLTATVAGGVDGSGGANQVVTWVDADTVDGDSDFTYDATADSNNGELILGAGPSSTTRINFQQGGLKVGPIAPNVGGLAGADDFTTVVSGSNVAISGSNVVSIGGSVTLGPEGSDPLLDMTNHVVHTIRGHQVEISGSAGGNNTNGSDSAIRLRAGKQIHLDAVADSTGLIYMTAADYDINAVANVNIDSTAGSISLGVDDGGSVTLGRVSHNSIVVTPHGTAGNEKTAIVNKDGTAADAIKIDAESGGLTLASGADVLSLDADGTGADALKMDSAGGIDISSSGAHRIDIESTNAAGHISLKTAHTAGVAVHIDADANAGSIVDIDAGILQIDATGVAGINSGGTLSLGTANSGVAVNIGHSTSETTIGQNLTVTGNLTVNGTTTTVDTTNLLVKDKLITLNDGGAAASAGASGIEFEEDGSATGFIKTATDRAGFEFQAPGNANTLTVDATASATLTVEGNSNLNQDLTTDAGVTFASVTANGGVTVDNITIDGTEIDLSSGDLTLDVAGDIILDADGDQIVFKNGSADIGHVDLTSEHVTIEALVQDKDIVFKGDDGGSPITALTLDMSDAGAASFNGVVTANAGFKADNITIDGTEIDLSSGDLTIDVAGDIFLNADGGDVQFRDDSTTFIAFSNSSEDAVIKAGTLNKDLIFQEDGGTEVFRLDSSAESLLMATNKKIELGAAEESIRGDGTDIHIAVGAGGNVNLPAQIGLTFGADTEKIEADASNNLSIISNGTLTLNSVGNILVGHHVLPDADNTLDLGSAGARYRNIYTGDLNLRNDRGDWTLIEEEDFISFRNNVTGRRFRMVMEDITGLGNYGPGNDGEM